MWGEMISRTKKTCSSGWPYVSPNHLSHEQAIISKARETKFGGFQKGNGSLVDKMEKMDNAF